MWWLIFIFSWADLCFLVRELCGHNDQAKNAKMPRKNKITYASPLPKLSGNVDPGIGCWRLLRLICPYCFSYFATLSCSASSRRLAFSGVMIMRLCTFACWMPGITDAKSRNLGKLRQMMRDWEAWTVAIHGFEESDTTGQLSLTQMILKIINSL